MASGEYTFKINQDTLTYTVETEIVGSEVSKVVTVIGYQGQGSMVELPDGIDGMKITRIDKKAFLGNHILRELILPKTVKRIENWALAQCINLETIVLLNPESVSFGKGVFDESPAIKDICLGSRERGTLSALLGAVPSKLEAEYLLTDLGVGSPEWYTMWDGKLASFLTEDDEEGYTAFVLCGEEDLTQSPPEFASEKRVRKSELCLLRLMHRDYLSADREQEFTDYILKHTKGCESDESWQALLTKYGDEMDYYRLFADLGGINRENVGGMLLDMGENHAEAKAFLMKYKQENFSDSDFFAGFDL